MPTNPFQGFLPTNVEISEQNVLPQKFGIGFVDVLLTPGNDSSKFSRAVRQQWTPGFMHRLKSHVQRVNELEYNDSYKGPNIVAFAGKLQFMMLFPSTKLEPKDVSFGRLPYHKTPPKWPFSNETQVWILPSPSGRAAMTHEKRLEPYRLCAEEFHRVPWPAVTKTSKYFKSL